MSSHTEEYSAEEIQARREAKLAWKSCNGLKLLANRLGVAKIIESEASASGPMGQYIQPNTLWWSKDWGLSDRRVNNITLGQRKAAILVDVLMSHLEEDRGIPAVLAHEIGHHIDWLAHQKWIDSAPNPRFLAEFEQAGFHVTPITESEVRAETLGRYLLGHALPTALRSKVRNILDKLPRNQSNLINRFRQQAQKQGVQS